MLMSTFLVGQLTFDFVTVGCHHLVFCSITRFKDRYFIRSSRPRWPNKPGKNVHPSVHTYVHNQIQCSHKPNSGICYGRWDIHDDMTFKVIRGQGQGHVRVSFKNDDFQNLSPPPFFNRSKKFQQFLILDQNTSNPSGRIFQFPPSYRVTWLQSLPKIDFVRY